MKKFNTVIIGGGASGLFSATLLKMKNKSLDIAILEKNINLGRKLSATGNGRCNFANIEFNREKYITNNKKELENILNKYKISDILEFYNKIGILEYIDRSGRIYPKSGLAKTVTEKIVNAILQNNVHIFTKVEAFKIKKENNMYKIETKEKKEILTKNVIFAVGGYSAPEFGTDGKTWKILRDMGINVKYAEPALCPLIFSDVALKDVRGARIYSDIKAFIERAEVYSEKNCEIQFNENNISGVGIMNASCYYKTGDFDKNCYISLNLYPEYSQKELSEKLYNIWINNKNVSSEDFINGLTNPKIGKYILEKYKIRSLNKENIEIISQILNSFEIKISGKSNFKHSQATNGGVLLTELDENMQLKKYKNFFTVGEATDVLGICGGYNLMWALISADLATDKIVEG